MRRWAAGVGLVVALALSLGGSAAAQTSSTACNDGAMSCAGTPFAQVDDGTSAAGAQPTLARTGVNTEQLLLMSVVAFGVGCLVLLIVEAREGRYAPAGTTVLPSRAT